MLLRFVALKGKMVCVEKIVVPQVCANTLRAKEELAAVPV